MKAILIADDDEPVRDLVATILGPRSRFNILLAKNGEEALRLAREQKPDLGKCNTIHT